LKYNKPPEGGFLFVNIMEDQKTTDIKVIFGLTLVHFIGDFYSSFINPLLPVFVVRQSAI